MINECINEECQFKHLDHVYLSSDAEIILDDFALKDAKKNTIDGWLTIEGETDIIGLPLHIKVNFNPNFFVAKV